MVPRPPRCAGSGGPHPPTPGVRSHPAAHRREDRQVAGATAALKNTGPPSSAPGGPFVADEVRAIVVLWVFWTACTFRAVPHAACDERCAAPRVAPHDQRAAQRAVVHHVSYRTVLERLALERPAVPELQRLTSLAGWLARQSPTRPVQEGKRRLVGRSFFQSCGDLQGRQSSPSDRHQKLVKVNAR